VHVRKIPLSVTEVVNLTGIPKRTVIDNITRGYLKAHKMPGLTGAYLIEPEDLDEYLANRPGRLHTRAVARFRAEAASA